MSTETGALERTMRERPLAVRARSRGQPSSSALEEFEQLYLRNIDALMRYFARRCHDPHTVADLTSETVLRAVEGFHRYDPHRGPARAWLFGIATHVYAHHCQHTTNHQHATTRLHAHRTLNPDEIEELTQRIDAERDGATLLTRTAQLPPDQRAAIELVDLEELTPKQAAHALGITRVALRKRLSRARTQLRKEHRHND